MFLSHTLHQKKNSTIIDVEIEENGKKNGNQEIILSSEDEMGLEDDDDLMIIEVPSKPVQNHKKRHITDLDPPVDLEGNEDKITKKIKL